MKRIQFLLTATALLAVHTQLKPAADLVEIKFGFEPITITVHRNATVYEMQAAAAEKLGVNPSSIQLLSRGKDMASLNYNATTLYQAPDMRPTVRIK